jgi:hypothetical protein
VVGLIVGFLVYAGLTRFLPEKETTSSMLEQPV